ncbi:tRNA (adenosine(37)-N6)-threonylcarbamoyltransferase complex ATPase subunit type 1 TsaE [Adhaeribacter aquaticus]|uniref:tRNA (adenosine(37)-N6)-threonylcarbamoyltransferase complex ATPase subunit type 1 TsaE n=1 Tax=Adhaeribacter aquaticus TaxID=299567 RepID=UPI0003FE7AF1|nr:tRNA (adenosine(37)-N6)-threonylcarbamoyltransferase complex ATPase subunit type 1 TsaE [Adhaeribacter aquaticus]
MNQITIELQSLADLKRAAAEVLNFAKNDKILLFQGEMAAGKTTLIKEICRLAGVEEPVSSPTYSLVNEYQSTDGKTLFHFDFYRIQDEAEALDMGAIEYFDSGNTCLIEWPSNVANVLPDHFVEVLIEKGTGEARTITLKRN